MSSTGRARGARRFVSSLVVVSAVTALASAWVPASASTVSASTALRDRAHQASSNSGNLIDHGGPILPTSHTYAIYWGNPGAWSSDVQTGIGSLFGGFNGSNLLAIGHQYMRGAAIASAYEGSKVDTSTPPRKASASNLGAEVAKVYGTNLDPEGIYFVYTSNFPNGGGFCAWHSATTVSGHPVAVAYMPNTTGVAGCDPGNPYGVSGSEGLRSLANVTSHEFMEAVTDTQISAWKDSSGSEIGDKCAWQFTGPVTLSNGTVWQLQEEWSNTISGCAQGT